MSDPSPEVHANRTVTFRLSLPSATKVELSLEGSPSIAMTKDSQGVWSCTTPVLEPDIYGYSFNVGGTTVLDSQNPLFKPNMVWQGNMVLVPGTPAKEWEVQAVPHGTLHRHFYHSGVVGDERDYYVYTPPGYKANGRTKYPVLYLLHGYSDTANGWTAVGQAHTILDNLIAEKRAKPMIIVMTLGYGTANWANPWLGNATRRNLGRDSYSKFRDSLLKEVIPQVQAEYRVDAKKESRAIAGLSMGGAETLYIGLNNLDTFGYVGAFSSGGLSGDFDTAFPDLSIEKANGLKEFMVACGVSDGLIDFNRQLKKWLEGKSIKFENVETPGDHSWMVWRRNLIAFSSKLFR